MSHTLNSSAIYSISTNACVMTIMYSTSLWSCVSKCPSSVLTKDVKCKRSRCDVPVRSWTHWWECASKRYWAVFNFPQFKGPWKFLLRYQILSLHVMLFQCHSIVFCFFILLAPDGTLLLGRPVDPQACSRFDSKSWQILQTVVKPGHKTHYAFCCCDHSEIRAH